MQGQSTVSMETHGIMCFMLSPLHSDSNISLHAKCSDLDITVIIIAGKETYLMFLDTQYKYLHFGCN